MEKSFELIRELTQQKSAVIIGRCSGAIYANDPEATTVFHADKDCRIKRVMERDGINEKKAAKLIKEVDEKSIFPQILHRQRMGRRQPVSAVY